MPPVATATPERPPSKRLVDFLVAATVTLVSAAVTLLPWRALGILGAFLGWLVGGGLRVRRAETERRMRAAGVDDAAAVAARMYRSLGTSLLELLWADRHPSRDLVAHVAFTPRALAAVEQVSATGAVVMTAHLASWDLVACRVAAETPLTVLTRRLSNAMLDRRWQALRAAKGVHLVSGEGALAACGEALRRRHLVAMMIDQAPLRAPGTVEAGFLGEGALHELTPALLAQRARVPILVAWGARDEHGDHRIDVVAVMPPPVDRAGAVDATLRASALLEAYVRETPQAWLWLHRRWKRPPQRGTRRAWTTSSESALTPSARGSSWAPASTKTSPRPAPP